LNREFCLSLTGTSNCRPSPLFNFQRVGEILKDPEQIVAPEKCGIDRDASKRLSVFGIAYGAGSGANLFGSLIDRTENRLDNCLEVRQPSGSSIESQRMGATEPRVESPDKGIFKLSGAALEGKGGFEDLLFVLDL
jgi:hypothetical protein